MTMKFSYTPQLIPNNLPSTDRRYARHELFRAFPWAVWNSSALEGYNFTLYEVETIINGYAPGNYPIDHIDDVRGIAAGWKTALQAIDQRAEADETLARQINHAITQKTSLAPGQFRGESTHVHGDGGNVRTPRGLYVAPRPEEIKPLWDDFAIDDPVQRSFLRIPFLARLQPFWDGNKRTALMLSAVDLINNGMPPLIVESHNFDQWHDALTCLFIDNNADPVLEVLTGSILKM